MKWLQQVATRTIFLVVGTIVGAWAPLVPFTKLRLHLDEAQLGSLLLCIGVGSMVAMPFSGYLAARFGCRSVILVTGLLTCLALPLLAFAPSSAALGAGLFLFGASIGCTDVTMNIQAVIVEREADKPMMSGFHGLFSLGGIAALMTGLLALGSTLILSAILIAAAMAAAVLFVNHGFLRTATEEPAPIFVFPRGQVLLLGFLCFVLFMAEGSMLDWSGILLTESAGMNPDYAGVGYIAFAIAMTVGRLSGDWLGQKLTPLTIVLAGSLCAALGLGVAVLSQWVPVTLLGFGFVGLGASNVVPVLFSATGRQQTMPAHSALSAVTTLGYAGMLVGPAAIGYVAHSTTLPIALTMIAGLLVCVAFSAKRATA